MKVVVVLALIKVVANALLKNDDLVAPFAIFLPNDKEKSNSIEKEEKRFWDKIKIRKLRPLPPTV